MSLPLARSNPRVSPNRGDVAVVFMDGEPVGTVTTTGWDTSWGFGEFRPHDRFGTFAPAFGLWSLLMHADGDDRRLSPAIAQELRHLENALDAIKVRLFFPRDNAWVDVFQLNIDGTLLEWKEY